MDSYVLKMLRMSASVAGRSVVQSISKAVKKYNGGAMKATEALSPASIRTRGPAVGSEKDEDDVVDFIFTPDHFRMRESLRKVS